MTQKVYLVQGDDSPFLYMENTTQFIDSVWSAKADAEARAISRQESPDNHKFRPGGDFVYSVLEFDLNPITLSN